MAMKRREVLKPAATAAALGVLPAPVLLGELACEAAGVRGYGNVLEIPGVARVTLGEYLVSAASRRLTLLRIELSAANSGVIELDSSETNGHPIP